MSVVLLPLPEHQQFAEDIVQNDHDHRGDEYLGDAEGDAQQVDAEQHHQLFDQQGGDARRGEAPELAPPFRVAAPEDPFPVHREGGDHRHDPGDHVDNGVFHRLAGIQHERVQQKAGAPVDDRGDHAHDDVYDQLPVFYKELFYFIDHVLLRILPQ